MEKQKRGISNTFILLLLRIGLLYALYGVCRIVFICYNKSFFTVDSFAQWVQILKGGFIFDSASIAYVNLPIVFFSLIPFYFKENRGWQTWVSFLYVTINAVALLINVTDIFYYPFKLARIASDDLHYLYEENSTQLFISFLSDYWWGWLMWLAMVGVLYGVGCRVFRLKKNVRLLRSTLVYYGIQSVVFVAMLLGAVFAIRGFSFSKSSFPISVSDASLYVKPNHTSIILSNPFCLIRTINKRIHPLTYYQKEEANLLFSPIKNPIDTALVYIQKPTDSLKKNIVLLVLESFGNGQIASLSGKGQKEKSCTPFLDSLFQEGLLFTNAYQSGNRSIDAMPSIWASIPSFKENFLSLPQSSGRYYAMGHLLSDMGYQSHFFHGAGRSSMSFVSFGQTSGIQNFVSREEYEMEVGRNDFDGKWGIWDHKFLPFVANKLSALSSPFFATIYTLSSHHPFALPKEFQGVFYDNPAAPIQKTIAYTDVALRNFFKTISKESWFDNTLFIITADHGSGSDIEEYASIPYSHKVPIFYYMPGNKDFPINHIETLSSHLDIAPTVMGLLGNKKQFFGFGKDALNDTQRNFVVNYAEGVYNLVTDSLLYQFDGKEIMGVFDYKTDFKRTKNLLNPNDQYPYVDTLKGYLQQYYSVLESRKYTP